MAQEYGLLRPGLTLFTYLHLAAVPELTRALVASGSTAIAYEAVQLDDGRQAAAAAGRDGLPASHRCFPC
jgi:alanine dehydrogenase